MKAAGRHPQRPQERRLVHVHHLHGIHPHLGDVVEEDVERTVVPAQLGAGGREGAGAIAAAPHEHPDHRVRGGVVRTAGGEQAQVDLASGRGGVAGVVQQHVLPLAGGGAELHEHPGGVPVGDPAAPPRVLPAQVELHLADAQGAIIVGERRVGDRDVARADLRRAQQCNSGERGQQAGLEQVCDGFHAVGDGRAVKKIRSAGRAGPPCRSVVQVRQGPLPSARARCGRTFTARPKTGSSVRRVQQNNSYAPSLRGVRGIVVSVPDGLGALATDREGAASLPWHNNARHGSPLDPLAHTPLTLSNPTTRLGRPDGIDATSARW